ncbi:hypothetical protein ABW19_dt0202390 [Dactylella cylindrospora]|nr:hypothetical protein ABW19_dt0202390 [Dactylella cylindrospora]
MTVAICLGRAAITGYKYAALRNYGECWMGNVLASTSVPISSNACNNQCNGTRSDFCGGPDALAVYENTAHTSDLGTFTYEGCYTNNPNEALLDHYANNWDTMTNELCAQYAAGFQYFGTQFSGKCFWGNELRETLVPSTGCATPCSGNKTQICGGANRFSLHVNSEYVAPTPPTVDLSYDPWFPVGCHGGNANATGLQNMYTNDTMTVDECLSRAASYRYAAVQEGGACYWGDALGASSKSIDMEDCDIGCAGEQKECEAKLKNILYENSGYLTGQSSIQAIIKALFHLKAAYIDFIAKVAAVSSSLRTYAENNGKAKPNAPVRDLEEVWAAMMTATNLARKSYLPVFTE